MQGGEGANVEELYVAFLETLRPLVAEEFLHSLDALWYAYDMEDGALRKFVQWCHLISQSPEVIMQAAQNKFGGAAAEAKEASVRETLPEQAAHFHCPRCQRLLREYGRFGWETTTGVVILYGCFRCRTLYEWMETTNRLVAVKSYDESPSRSVGW